MFKHTLSNDNISNPSSMKMKRIILGMSFGNYWNSIRDTEQKDSQPGVQATTNTDVIATLTCLIDKQQAIIEQQQAAIEEIKTMMKEVKLKVEKLFHAEAYLVEE